MAQARGRSETRCRLVIQVAKKSTNSLEGVDADAVQVNRVAAPVREQVLDQLRQAIVLMRFEPEQRLVERAASSRPASRARPSARCSTSSRPRAGDHPPPQAPSSPRRRRARRGVLRVRAMLEGMAARQFAERTTSVHLRALRRAFKGIERRAKAGRQQPGDARGQAPLLRCPLGGRQRHHPEPTSRT